jgi:DNA-binding CsgD family transcriptional regulator
VGAVSLALAAIQSPIGLTPREREIAVLVAQGHTNRQIADTLHLSVRTVEGHIFRAAAKVDVINRSELGAVTAHLDKH